MKSHQHKQRWPESTELLTFSSQQLWHTSSWIFSSFTLCDCIMSPWQPQQLLRSRSGVIYFSDVLMPFVSLKAGEPAPCALLALPRPQAGPPWTMGRDPLQRRRWRRSFGTENDAWDIYYRNSPSVPDQSLYFFDRVYIYVNYNQLSRNKEVPSENPITFIWNSRIPSPNQLWVRGFVFCEVTWVDISAKLGPLSQRSTFLK